jgi:homogentisate solanesyltransferase
MMYLLAALAPVLLVFSVVDGFAPTSQRASWQVCAQQFSPPLVKRCGKQFFMSVEGDFDPDAIEKARSDVQSGSIKARMRAIYKFTRPHTIRGTILASIAGTTRALIDTPGAISNANWSFMLPRAILGMTALLLGNAFIVGINQIYDKDIDILNKPFLPVASGEMSKRFAWVVVVFSGLVGPCLVHQYFPPLLFKLYTLGIVLGGIYSVPPIRTKQNPFLAGLTIATVRGFLLNFGVYYAVKDAIGAPFAWSPKVAFIARFMTIFATVIAVTKDLPDIEGDKVCTPALYFLFSLNPGVAYTYRFDVNRRFKSRHLLQRWEFPALLKVQHFVSWLITFMRWLLEYSPRPGALML